MAYRAPYRNGPLPTPGLQPPASLLAKFDWKCLDNQSSVNTLREHSLQKITSLSDGNCTFASIAMAVYGSEGHHRRVRTEICDFLQNVVCVNYADMSIEDQHLLGHAFGVLDNQVGLIFRSALPEELEWDNRAEDVALSLESIKRCLINMLTALDRDTPQPKDRLPSFFPPHLEPNTSQEPPWLWFTLPELGFPLLIDEFLRPIHPEIEEYMRRHVSNDHDWEQVDDEDCWGIDYVAPTPQILGKMTAILHTWGEELPETAQIVA